MPLQESWRDARQADDDKLNLMSRELVTVIRDEEKDAIPPIPGLMLLILSEEQI